MKKGQRTQNSCNVGTKCNVLYIASGPPRADAGPPTDGFPGSLLWSDIHISDRHNNLYMNTVIILIIDIRNYFSLLES